MTLLIPPVAWLMSSGDPLAYFTHHVPPGQLLFVASKLCALMALVLFWLQCMMALSRIAPALHGFFQLSRRQHIVLGCTTALMVVLHVGLFVTASTLRTKASALDMLVPTFTHGYYRSNIGLGAIAFWVLFVGMLGGTLRLWRGTAWRWVHRAVFVVFTLGFLHGVAIGSETRFGLMKYIYAFVGLSIGTVVCSWVWHEIAKRRRVPVTNPADGSPAQANRRG